MPKILNDNVFTVYCSACNKVLTYTADELEHVDNNYMGIICPNCDEPVRIEYVKSFSFPKTFIKCSKENGAVHIDDSRVQEIIDRVLKQTKILPCGEVYIEATGDTLVFGYRGEEEIVIYVTQDYWSDFVIS